MRRLRSKLPPLTSLVAFEAAARHLSFTRAAEELHVTQGAVSRQVRTLEDYLGTHLFQRFHRAIQLTPQGRKFQQAVTLGLEHIANAAGELRATQTGAQITIAATIAFASFWLMPRLATFRVAFPDIDVRVLATDQEIDDVTDGIDIALCYGKGDWPGFEATFLLDEEIFPICSPAYLQRRPAITTPADLLRETLLHLDEGHGRWVDWRMWLREQGVEPAGVQRGLKLNNYPMLVQAALEGEGIALGWRHLVDDLLARGALLRPIPATLHTRRGYFLVTPAGVPLGVEAAAFRDWILAEVASSAVSHRAPPP